MALRLDGLGLDRFLSERWRQRPVLLRGAAPAALGRSVSYADFRTWADRLQRRGPMHIDRVGDGTVFLQNIDAEVPELAARSAASAAALGCRRVWFDGVLAVDGSGIGSHYDHSDNLVLQQHGTKIWRLAPPERVPEAELRARMLDADNGLVDMPDEAETFVVEAGDLLYIPLFWAHWGVSVGRSLSLSIVFNADHALDVLLPALRAPLSERRRWWWPLPLVPAVEAAERAAEAEAALETWVDGLLDDLSDPDRRPALRASMLRAARGTEAESGGSGPPHPLRVGYGRRSARVALVPAERLDPWLEAAARPLDPALVLSPALSPDALAGLERRAGLAPLRALANISENAGLWVAPALLPRLVAWLERVAEAGPGVLSPWMAGWCWRAAEALFSQYPPRIAEVFSWLPEPSPLGELGSGGPGPDAGAGGPDCIAPERLRPIWPRAGHLGVAPLGASSPDPVRLTEARARLGAAWPELAAAVDVRLRAVTSAGSPGLLGLAELPGLWAWPQDGGPSALAAAAGAERIALLGAGRLLTQPERRYPSAHGLRRGAELLAMAVAEAWAGGLAEREGRGAFPSPLEPLLRGLDWTPEGAALRDRLLAPP